MNQPFSLRVLVSVAVSLVVVVALTVLVFALVARDEQVQRSTQSFFSNQTQLAHRMARLASSASAGMPGSADALVAMSDSFSANLGMIERGMVSELDEPSMERLMSAWRAVEAHIATDEDMQAVELAIDRVIVALGEVERRYLELQAAKPYMARHGYLLAGLALVLIFVFTGLLIANYNTRRAAFDRELANEKHQQAIMRLLKEMRGLADGDLTVRVTVARDMTGAIAESINYAVEALRNLVATINHTAVKVAAAAEQSQQIAAGLSTASERQAEEVAAGGGAIERIAGSIDHVAHNAQQSSVVASQQVELANKGGTAVRRTIEGMGRIREHIQETSKRIKRLGESSQEIGDIVELINGIAEQTNIIALNAAIQSSSSGESGRGFSVVADEVQRLAERVTAATRQIEALVQTIQADTNEAMASMEQSTAGVVSGAALAEDAGAALVEIEGVARRLATMVEEISTTVSDQTQASSEAVAAMQAIREITRETDAGTRKSAGAIGKLSGLATQLRESVSGFKLPPSDPTASGRYALDVLRKAASRSKPGGGERP